MEDLSTKMLALKMHEDNFGFAFNDSDLSDRILLIKIMPEDSLGSDTTKYLKWFSRVHEAQSNDSECCAGVKVKTMHISSPILAAKSPFFYKLFKNGMRESQHKDVTLIVNASEEAALMELLYFMYHKTLRVTSAPELLDVLMAADKFEVISCMIYCIQLLIKVPMSLESALLYLELPSSVLVAEIVQPLVDEAKQYLVAHYRDFTKSQEELMELSLSALEAVLGSDSLRVNSENDVYDFILKWARAHYTNLEERREIFTKHLTQFINFPYMSCNKLKEVAVCPDFDGEVSKLVLEALCHKVEVPYGQHIHTPKDLTTTKCSGSGRVYIHRLIKVVYLEFPWPHCVVYFDLRKDECANLISSKTAYSQSFLLGGQWFFLKADCSQEHKFGLFMKMIKGSESCRVDFEFAVMNKLSKEFQIKLKVKNHTFKGEGWGAMDLLGISWAQFMSEDSEYFINGILHLRVEVIIHSQATLVL